MQKQSRRTFLRLGGMAATGAILAACGSSPEPPSAEQSPTSQSSGPAAAAGQQTTVKFQSDWYANQDPNFLSLLIQKFQEQQPNLKIEWIKAPVTTEELLTAVAGGTAPDCYHITSGITITELATRNVVRPIDDLMKTSSINMDDYLPAQFEGTKYNGKSYALPVLEGGPINGFSWNKTLFREAGLDPDKGPSSWDEVNELSSKLTKKDANGNIEILGFDPLNAQGSDVLSWAMAADTLFISDDKTTMLFDQPIWEEILTFISDIYKAQGPDKIEAFRTNWEAWTGGQKSGFANGKEAMIINGYWQPGELAKTLADKSSEFGYAFVPSFNNAKKVSALLSHYLVMPQSSEIPNETFTWMEYVMSPEANKLEFDFRGGFLWSKSLVKELDVSRYPGLDFFMQLPTASDKVVGANPYDSPIAGEISTLWGRAIDEANFGRKEPKQTLIDINTELQRSLDRVRQATGG